VALSDPIYTGPCLIPHLQLHKAGLAHVTQCLDAVLKWSFSPLPLKHCLHFPTSSPEFLYLCPCHDQFSGSTRILEGVIHLASEEERPL
jgi:hypothetical protein